MSYASRETSRSGGAPVECYRFVQGSSLWLWTTADVPVVLPTGTYSPATLERGGIDLSAEEEGGSLELTVPRGNPVALLFRDYLPATPVSLTVFRAHRGEESDVRVRFLGTVASVRFDGPSAMLVCQPLRSVFRRSVPGLRYQSQCNWSLYGTGCGVSPASFRDTVTIGTVSGVSVTSGDFAARASGWFRNGWLELPTGERRFIVAHVGDTVTLMNPLPALVPGAVVAAYAGCDRTEAACSSKFANLQAFFGFPRIPTRNPHSGSVV